MQFTITDLFIVGLGLEFVGAWLVARGLLLPLPALKTFGTHAGIGVADVVDRARNRVDGQFGVVLLLLGFLTQLLGYLLEIDGEHPLHGTDHLLTAVALLGLSTFFSISLWRLVRGRLFKRALVRIAMAPLRTTGSDIEQGEAENIKWLARYGKAANWQGQMYESDETYVKRVFDLKL